MFYGNFPSDQDRSEFDKAIKQMSKYFRKTTFADNLITFNRNLTFTEDDDFIKSFDNNAKTRQEKSLKWRLHTLCWAGKHCLHLSGDFVECGVYLGFSMSVLAEYLHFHTLQKKMYLYDTFEGIPEAYNSEQRSNHVYEQIPDIHEQVVKKFAEYKNVEIIQGIVPDSFSKATPKKIAFLHIDMNSSKSEIAALEKLFNKVVKGGIIIFDDFGWMGYDKQTKAEIEWLGKKGYSILELPTGQGLVIKR